jgi:RNA polymerase sigma factor for flagellar operon FliA
MNRRAIATYASTTSEADDLVQRYSVTIDRIARRLVMRIGLRSAFDDLWSAGALGLLEAAPRFDPARGVSFETFVEHRVRGAMLDELRRMDHLPRRLRSRTDDLQKAKQKLSSQLGREATSDEIAAELNVELDEISGIEALLEPHVSLDKAQNVLVTETEIEDKLGRAETVQALAKCFTELPERLQTILGLHYLEGLTYREIAKMMDVSEPRICQLHADGLKKLRGALAKMNEGDQGGV